MEESVDFLKYFKDTFNIEQKKPESYSPLALAYIGDAIFDLMIRSMVVSKSNKQVEKYHKKVTSIVSAGAQAKMMKGIRDSLTEEEHAIYKRGRNANFNSKAKNATRSEYRNATAFEAVLGYLYLKEDYKRLVDVVQMGLEVLEKK
jgi:ribonuclease-3 family protein